MSGFFRTVVVLGLGAVALSASALSQSMLVVPSDPVVLDQLARAEDAVKAHRDHALGIWQSVLDGGGSKVLAVHHAASRRGAAGSVGAGDRFVGVRGSVMSQIRALPDQGLARYRELMEPRARELLDDGRAQEDEDALRDCGRRFALTRSGRDAHLALVDLLLEQGRFAEAIIAARRLWSAVVTTGDSDEWAARVLSREGLALFCTGRAAELVALRERCARDGLDERTLVAAGEIKELGAFLESLGASATEERVAETPGLGGVRRAKWKRRLARSADRGEIDSWRTDVSEGVYRVVPAVSQGAVFACDGLGIHALGLASGAALWPRVSADVSRYVGSENPDVRYEVVVAGDLVIGCLQGAPALDRPWSSWTRAIPSHKLVAVDRKTGVVRWSHLPGLEPGLDESDFLAELSIDQPPLVVGDTLYAAGAVLNGIFHHWVCALEVATGRVRWRTYLGAGQTDLGRGGNPVRAAVPGCVAEKDGVLFTCTNMGVVAAVDAVNGAILWQTAYAPDPYYGGGGWGSRRRGRPILEPAPGWLPARPVFAGGKVLFAPADARRLLVADPRTGEMTGVRVDSGCAMVGVHDGLVLHAAERLTAFDPVKMANRWSVLIPGVRSGAVPVEGRPLLIDGHILLTTSRGAPAIHRFDAATGRHRESRILPGGTAGNLLLAPNAFLIAGPDTLALHRR